MSRNPDRQIGMELEAARSKLQVSLKRCHDLAATYRNKIVANINVRPSSGHDQ